jgi:hypothetical protein
VVAKRRSEIKIQMDEMTNESVVGTSQMASQVNEDRNVLEEELGRLKNGGSIARGFSATESGLPFLFLTLTADEVSEYKWQCIKDLEKDLKVINEKLDFRDAPVECARIFHKRCERFMSEWIYVEGGKKKGVFGRILDYVIRYEIQDRG